MIPSQPDRGEVGSEIAVLDKGIVRLLGWMGDDALICGAARVSYGKGTRSVSEDRALIRFMMRHGHTSPFEHVVFRFYVKAPLFVIRQWHRHRTWSYNEISGRYSEIEDDFFVPDEGAITRQSATNKQGGTSEPVVGARDCREQFQTEQAQAFAAYQGRLGKDMRRELARVNLPLATYTEMYATVDLHNLFHFLSLRMDAHAQQEIRDYANAMFALIQPIVPIATEAFLDYRLGSVQLSRLEVEALRTGKPLATENKRELAEWEEKKKRLGIE